MNGLALFHPKKKKYSKNFKKLFKGVYQQHLIELTNIVCCIQPLERTTNINTAVKVTYILAIMEYMKRTSFIFQEDFMRILLFM